MITGQKNYLHKFDLKYGCNPYQKPAAVHSLNGQGMPFEVINGKPGYINLLDALNAWQLVNELDQVLNLPAAASFKHLSPAGAAVSVPLNDELDLVYGCKHLNLSPLATAYVRARGADPLSSFGDFIALSRKVDLSTANVIRRKVSDGIIAPGYDHEALNLIMEKKDGEYLILKADPEYIAPKIEYREVNGVAFTQPRNTFKINQNSILKKVVTKNKEIPAEAVRDLIIASITLKYTQSNSVGYALDGQMIGIGAGQQSRVDCTKLAGLKADKWYLRQHPEVIKLPFLPNITSLERTNARTLFIEGGMTDRELQNWQHLFENPIEPLSQEKKADWMSKLNGVSLSSDAFFPFRDNIDHASKRGVSFIVQPGGSNRDNQIIEAADEYGMSMTFSGLRLFHH